MIRVFINQYQDIFLQTSWYFILPNVLSAVTSIKVAKKWVEQVRSREFISHYQNEKRTLQPTNLN